MKDCLVVHVHDRGTTCFCIVKTHKEMEECRFICVIKSQERVSFVFRNPYINQSINRDVNQLAKGGRRSIVRYFIEDPIVCHSYI